MIDIHTHILFGVDDGARTIEETRQLLEEAVAQGIRNIVVTPHYREGMFEAGEDEIRNSFQATCELASQIHPDLEILLGREIYFAHDSDFAILPTWSLGKSNSLLVEFRKDVHYREIYNHVYGLLRKGYQVVLAHIERYPRLTLEQIEQLRHLGCFIQVNADCVSRIGLLDKRRRSKKCVQDLLKKGLVDIVASDVHNQTTRRNCMQAAYQYVCKKYGSSYAQQLFLENPRIVIKNGSFL